MIHHWQAHQSWQSSQHHKSFQSQLGTPTQQPNMNMIVRTGVAQDFVHRCGLLLPFRFEVSPTVGFLSKLPRCSHSRWSIVGLNDQLPGLDIFGVWTGERLLVVDFWRINRSAPWWSNLIYSVFCIFPLVWGVCGWVDDGWWRMNEEWWRVEN